MTTILLVDDNDTQRKLISAQLEHAGYEVTAACSGREALALIRSIEPDLVVSDVVMDELDGFGLCAELRRDIAFEHVPIVLLSARTSEADRARAIAVGAAELIERSPDFEAELRWIDRTVRGSSPGLPEKRRSEHNRKLESIAHLTGGLAHDFNNYLGVILSSSASLLEELPEGAARVEAKAILDAAQRAAELTRRLLAFGRRTPKTPRKLDLNELLAGLANMLVRLIGSKVSMSMYRCDRLGAVRADTGQLEQVIVNLVVNARDAMPEGGHLVITTSNDHVARVDSISDRVPPGHYVVLEVSDTGCGMDAETKERMFEPFFTTKAYGKGTGLGLSMIDSIVRELGGYIIVHSEVGQGSVFRVFLPELGEQPPKVIETILVVEDDVRVRKVIERILGTQGYRVIAAHDGDEALEAVGLSEQDAQVDS